MMLDQFRISLLFLTLYCLSCHAIVQERNTVSSINQTSRTTPLLTKQEILGAFDSGIKAGATHMLIVWDTWDVDDSYNFIVYSYPGEEVNDLIKYYNAPGFYHVSAVLALHLDPNQQLNEKRWYPEYP